MTSYTTFTLVLLAATAFDQTFDSATAAYKEGDFNAAANLFEQLIGEGIEDPAVFCNAGNAYYRKGLLAAAIANYERALQVAPDCDEAEQNLRLCIGRTQGRLDRPLPPDWEQALLFWHYGLAPRAIYKTAMVAWLAVWTVLTVRRWKPARWLRPTAVVLGAVALVFSVSAWVKANPSVLAVGARSTVAVRYGPEDSTALRFELHEGDRVVVDMRREGWSRVTTAAGDQGWTRNDGLILVGPPYERPNLDAATDEEELGSRQREPKS